MEHHEETTQGGSKAKKAKYGPFRAAQSLYRRVPVGWRIAIVGILGFLVLLLFGIFHPYMQERVKFVSANTLNLLLLIAIIVQAIIYARQRAEMGRQRETMQGQLEVMRDTLNQNERASEREWFIAREQLNLAGEQWKTMGEQTIISKGQMDIAIETAKITEKQLEAMQGQLEATEKGLRISQRAYVGIKRHPVLKWNAYGQPIMVLIFTNSGHTPAEEAELAFEFTIDGKPFKDCKNGFTIGAHTDKSLECVWRGAAALDSEIIALIDSGESILFFEADLSYWDAWGQPQSCDALRYTYNSESRAMEEFFESEIRHTGEKADRNPRENPN